jgi:hypothetical protein
VDKSGGGLDRQFADTIGHCWIWTGDTHIKGYGRFCLNGQNLYAHRVSYEWAKGPIPKGWVVDHVCYQHSCVNPDHLVATTDFENIYTAFGRGKPVAVMLRIISLAAADQDDPEGDS